MRTVGLELEVGFDCGETEAGEVLNSMKSQLYDYDWRVYTDTSCGGFEVVSPPRTITPDFVREIKSVVRMLKEQPVCINNQCGLHVHVDAQEIQPNHYVNLLQTWKDFESMIFDKFQPKKERMRWMAPLEEDEGLNQRINEYRRFIYHDDNTPLPMDGMTNVSYIWTGSPYSSVRLREDKYNEFRYRAFNLNSVWYHGTVEFRLFNTTFNVREIVRSLLFSHNFVRKVTRGSRLYDYYSRFRMDNFLSKAYEELQEDTLKRLQRKKSMRVEAYEAMFGMYSNEFREIFQEVMWDRLEEVLGIPEDMANLFPEERQEVLSYEV